MKTKNPDLMKILSYRKSPLAFIEDIWKLVPQPIKPEWQTEVQILISENRYKEIRAEYFEKFIKGEHLTWQQYLILKSVERALSKQGKNKISISSGHGIGKSNVLSMLILWYLFCFKDAQIPCTAPTSEQMHDILWKELAAMHKRMPAKIQSLYDWSANYIRIVESPETWFARAKTARKENPEALAGVHGDHVMFVVDESSGVPQEIFNTAEGAMTGENVIVIMISNPTRMIGYFYDSHNSDKEAWETMQFSSKDSPIVNEDYITRITEKHGEESDEYKIRVLGEFPAADAIDDQGYVPLFLETDLRQVEDMLFVGDCLMGIDPAGEGKDETVWVVRDRFKSKIVCKEKISNEKSIAEKTLTLMDYYKVRPENIYVDNFGIGANVAQEMAIEGYRVNGINVGDKAYDERFVNLRAEVYWKIKEWVRTGGEFITHDGWKELLYIRYRNQLGGKLQIMPKGDMKKKLGRSPDHADALSLTFVRPAKSYIDRELNKIRRSKRIINNRLRMA
ncbi:MAG: hypothetical protein NTW30_05655 [Candidatus Aenigmarchaeota archaeon]|nr:hypothetical protein [Candidatus Aenigmarchaeota archaeon]